MPAALPILLQPGRLVPGGRGTSTGEWRRVAEEASRLGVLQAGFSGGEPLLRADLPELVAAFRAAGLYTNLITSAVGLTKKRTEELRDAGLDNIQISFQSDQEALANGIAGTAAHQTKLRAARMVRELCFPLTVNVVLHRGNIGRVTEIISLAENLEAERLELANTQYYGWAFQNRKTAHRLHPQPLNYQDSAGHVRGAENASARQNENIVRHPGLLQ